MDEQEAATQMKHQEYLEKLGILATKFQRALEDVADFEDRRRAFLADQEKMEERYLEAREKLMNHIKQDIVAEQISKVDEVES